LERIERLSDAHSDTSIPIDVKMHAHGKQKFEATTLLESHISYVKIKTFLNQTLIPKQYE
jgi:hypothetical protein